MNTSISIFQFLLLYHLHLQDAKRKLEMEIEEMKRKVHLFLASWDEVGTRVQKMEE